LQFANHVRFSDRAATFNFAFLRTGKNRVKDVLLGRNDTEGREKKAGFLLRRLRYYILDASCGLGIVVRKTACLWVAISSFWCVAAAVAAVTSRIPPMRPPQFLNIYRESVKVANLDRYTAIEREAVRTCVRVKCPNIYFAAESREQDTQWTWFFSLFDSREDVDRAAAIYAQNAELHTAMARIVESKKDIVSPPQNTLAKYREDLSRDFGVDIPHARLLTITVIQVRDGHLAEFEERQELVNRMTGKRDSESAYARPVGLVYQAVSGTTAETFYVILPQHNLLKREQTSPRDSAAEAEVNRLTDVAVADSAATLPTIRPDFSCVPRNWIAVDPDFWAPAGINDWLPAQ
jgi:hypothetical protein